MAGAEVIITQVSAEIDGHLRAQGYVIPVSDQALLTLMAYCMSGSAARILRNLGDSSGAQAPGDLTGGGSHVTVFIVLNVQGM